VSRTSWQLAAVYATTHDGDGEALALAYEAAARIQAIIEDPKYRPLRLDDASWTDAKGGT